MDSSERLRRALESAPDLAGRRLSEERPAGATFGGATVRAVLDDGTRLFAKIGSGSAEDRERVRAEGTGLRTLAKAADAAGGRIRVPTVLAEAPELGVLAIEWMDTSPPPAGFDRRFGRGLAELHHHSADETPFGFSCDTFLGATRQPNGTSAESPSVEGWIHFFSRRRLQPMLASLEATGAPAELLERTRLLIAALPTLLTTASAPSCLLHGDLWSGNVLCSGNRPVLIDPAVYRGHREADLGMVALFGGVSDGFWQAYDASWPLEDGWRRRLEVYRLYHLLNHRLLFGPGYDQPSLRCLRELLGP